MGVNQKLAKNVLRTKSRGVLLGNQGCDSCSFYLKLSLYFGILCTWGDGREKVRKSYLPSFCSDSESTQRDSSRVERWLVYTCEYKTWNILKVQRFFFYIYLLLLRFLPVIVWIFSWNFLYSFCLVFFVETIGGYAKFPTLPPPLLPLTVTV